MRRLCSTFVTISWTQTLPLLVPEIGLELTGVPKGDYILDRTPDPTVRLVEEDKMAERLGPGPACEAR